MSWMISILFEAARQLTRTRAIDSSQNLIWNILTSEDWVPRRCSRSEHGTFTFVEQDVEGLNLLKLNLYHKVLLQCLWRKKEYAFCLFSLNKPSCTTQLLLPFIKINFAISAQPISAWNWYCSAFFLVNGVETLKTVQDPRNQFLNDDTEDYAEWQEFILNS